MERYWCLRWILQERVTELTAEAIRDDLVRFSRLPLVCRAHSMPALAPGTRVEVAVSDVDLVELEFRCEHKKTLEPSSIST